MRTFTWCPRSVCWYHSYKMRPTGGRLCVRSQLSWCYWPHRPWPPTTRRGRAGALRQPPRSRLSWHSKRTPAASTARRVSRAGTLASAQRPSARAHQDVRASERYCDGACTQADVHALLIENHEDAWRCECHDNRRHRVRDDLVVARLSGLIAKVTWSPRKPPMPLATGGRWVLRHSRGVTKVPAHAEHPEPDRIWQCY